MGAAPNIILGLALGYMSTIIPILLVTSTIFFGQQMSGNYGVTLAAIGMMSTKVISMAINGFGPISDTAFSIC
jgi:Na+/H+-translocating membrane pyrophosphatase